MSTTPGRITPARRPNVWIAALLIAAATFPAFSDEARPTPPALQSATSASTAAPNRQSVFVGLGFYSGQAELAGSQRGRASTRVRVSFESPEAAVAAFVSAMERADITALDAMLGPGNSTLLFSGNADADAVARAQFIHAYQAGHAVVAQADGSRLLEVGDSGWLFPIPVIAVDGVWSFDAAAGAAEINNRNIGHSELGAIAVCRTFIEAQKAYAAQGRDGHRPGAFAARLFSDKGKRNGLHWRPGKGEPPSPALMPVTGIPHVPEIPQKLLYDLAPKTTDRQKPFHGYYFRMLFAQGTNARGGAANYYVDDLLTGGIALLGWPADYGSSGVMSFMVNHDGVVYQKDLGADTAVIVQEINLFDPDHSWSIVE